MSDEFQATGEITKFDDDLGLAFGWAIVCKNGGEDYFDLQGDHIPENAMLNAAADFMQNQRVAGHMHKFDYSDPALSIEEINKVEPRGTVVFAFPLTTQLAKAFNIQTDKTGLMIAMRPDQEMLKEFRDGKLTGFSIGGFRGEDEVVE